MFRIRLMTAAAATVLLAAAPAAFAQDMTSTQTPPVQTPPVVDAPMTPPVTADAEVAADAAVAASPVVANSVIDVLKERGEFTTLLAALDQAQLTETLASRPAITLFAPTDAAFAAVPEAERTRLMDPANAQELRNLLLYHVIVSDVTTAQITGAAGSVETAGGVKVQIDGSGEGIKVDEAMASAEIDAGNGAVFPIDTLLNPAQSGAAMGDEDAATTPATTPAASAATSPSGEVAVTTTTTASPPVANPTDGQVDAKPDATKAAPPAGEAEEPETDPEA